MKQFWKTMTAEYENFDMSRLGPEDIRQLRQIGAEVGLAGVALGLTAGGQIWDHIEREYHPFTPIKKLPEPRPPP
jgi:hypothetical protein